MKRHLAAVGAILALTSCGSQASQPSSTTLTVFAATSLTAAFRDEAKAFETLHPNTHVALDFGASSTLATQIVQGGPAGVFASADETTMKTVTDAHLTSSPPVIFAHNRLQIVVAKGDPKRIETLADLARPDVVTVLCEPQVPCGRYAAAVLKAGHVNLTPKALAPDVKGVIRDVALAEADAGIAYATDVKADKSVDGIAVGDYPGSIAAYPVAPLAQGASTASAFVGFLLSTQGQGILSRYGFLPP